MAKSAETPEGVTPEESTDWETIPTGLGNEWDFDRDGPLTGYFLGKRTVETRKTDSGEAIALQFAPQADQSQVALIWESSELAEAFGIDPATNTSLINVGDLVRITFLGRHQFTTSDGKARQIKRYKVEAAKKGTRA